MRLAIGVPTSHGFPIPAPFWVSYEAMACHLRNGGGTTIYPGRVEHFSLLTSGGFPVDVARNEICRDVLRKDFTHLLFLDADHLMPVDLVDRLAAHQKDVITARYHVRRPPFHANAYVAHPAAPPGQFKTVHYGRGCFEIDRGGAGALLISRAVLEAVGDGTDEWFRYQRNPNEGQPSDFSVSEDFYFYQRAQECGFSCWVDWDTECQHLTMLPVGREHNQVYLEAMERELTPELASQLVACGYDAPLTINGHTIAPHVPAGVLA